MGDFFAILLTLLLILANAFFVAAEFALISARRDRLEALAEKHDVEWNMAKALQAELILVHVTLPAPHPPDRAGTGAESPGSPPRAPSPRRPPR